MGSLATRFLITGFSGFVVYWLAFQALSPFAARPIALAASYLAAAVVHFTLSKYFTFQEPSKERLPGNVAKYVATLAITTSLNVAAVTALHDWMGFDINVSLAGGVVASMALSFLMMKAFVFARG